MILSGKHVNSLYNEYKLGQVENFNFLVLIKVKLYQEDFLKEELTMDPNTKRRYQFFFTSKYNEYKLGQVENFNFLVLTKVKLYQ